MREALAEATRRIARRNRRRQILKAAKTNLKPALHYFLLAFAGISAARLFTVMLDTMAARTGNPGGEIFIPLFAFALPAIGWWLRGEWDKPDKGGENR